MIENRSFKRNILNLESGSVGEVSFINGFENAGAITIAARVSASSACRRLSLCESNMRCL